MEKKIEVEGSMDYREDSSSESEAGSDDSGDDNHDDVLYTQTQFETEEKNEILEVFFHDVEKESSTYSMEENQNSSFFNKKITNRSLNYLSGDDSKEKLVKIKMEPENQVIPSTLPNLTRMDQFEIEEIEKFTTKEIRAEQVQHKMQLTVSTDITAVFENTTDLNKTVSDEFDIDEMQPSDRSVILDAIENAARRAGYENIEEEKAAGSVNALHSSIPEEIQNENNPSTNCIQVEAMKALHGVLETYSTGLGDQSVTVLNTESRKEKKDNLSYELYMKKLNDTIHEVDEESIELAELEEEFQQQHAKIQEASIQEKLISEWEEVEKNAAYAFDDAEPGKSVESSQTSSLVLTSKMTNTTFVDYHEGLLYLKSSGLDVYMPLIQIKDESNNATSKKKWFNVLTKSSNTPTLTYPDCEVDIKLPFLIAQKDCDMDDSAHFAMLRNIYNFFIVTKESISKTGPHWERIGFQGLDPRTDLNRSMKILSVIQMLHMIETQPNLSRSAYELSGCAIPPTYDRNDTSKSAAALMDHSWPFFCVSINFTKESIQTLRSCKVYDLCNEYKSSMEAIHVVHHACFLEFVRLLRAEPSLHHAVHLKTIRQNINESHQKLIKNFFQFSQKTIQSNPPLHNTKETKVSNKSAASTPERVSIKSVATTPDREFKKNQKADHSDGDSLPMLLHFHNLDSLTELNETNVKLGVDDGIQDKEKIKKYVAENDNTSSESSSCNKSSIINFMNRKKKS